MCISDQWRHESITVQYSFSKFFYDQELSHSTKKFGILFHVTSSHLWLRRIKSFWCSAGCCVLITEVFSFLISLSIWTDGSTHFKSSSDFLSWASRLKKNANQKRQCWVIIVSICAKDQSVLRSLWATSMNSEKSKDVAFVTFWFFVIYWRVHATGN